MGAVRKARRIFASKYVDKDTLVGERQMFAISRCKAKYLAPSKWLRVHKHREGSTCKSYHTGIESIDVSSLPSSQRIRATSLIKARDFSNVVDANTIAREGQGGSGKEIRDPEGGFICQSVNLELVQLVASRQIQVGSIHTSSGSESQSEPKRTRRFSHCLCGADSYRLTDIHCSWQASLKQIFSTTIPMRTPTIFLRAPFASLAIFTTTTIP